MNLELVIHALGGDHEAARKLGVKPATVSKWRERGYIPIDYVLRVGAYIRGDLRRMEPAFTPPGDLESSG